MKYSLCCITRPLMPGAGGPRGELSGLSYTPSQAMKKLLLITTFALAAAAPALAEDHTPLDKVKNAAEFSAYLAKQGLAQVMPLPQLLRTATDWKRCAGPQFEVPPRERWEEVSKVLSLVAELKRQGILHAFEGASNYRNPKLNRCAGGAGGSAHTRMFAVDIVPKANGVDEKRLCQFWRTEGRKWNMGLSRYPSGRIHLDTMNWRTWGAGHTSKTAFCG